VNATAEMCVHYLLFDAATRHDPLGGLLKVNPPIRSGEIDKPCGKSSKAAVALSCRPITAPGRWSASRTPSIFDVAAGMPGLEVWLPAFFTAATKRYGDRAVHAMTADYCSAMRHPRFFGLATKGRLAPGYDADIAVLAAKPWSMTPSCQPARAGLERL
jgi:allantoinase